MSVIRMLTRMCAVAALRGQTWADDRVFDSDNTPLAQALTLNAAAKPYIVVFTDADNRTGIEGKDVYSGKREMALVLEIGVASKIEGETGGEQIKTPLTDEGMEIALDMVEHQVFAALFGNPRSEWADLMKDLVVCVERIPGQRGASADRDRRWAARQVTFVCDVMADLPPGVAVPHDHPIRKFVEVVKGDPDAGMGHAALICGALIKEEPMADWEQVQSMLGVNRLGLRAIGLAPLSSDLPVMATAHGDDLTDKEGEAPILRKISHDDMQMEPDLPVGLQDLFSIETNVMKQKAKDKKDKVAAEGDVKD